METLGFIFGMIGMSLGVTGFIFGIICLSKIQKLMTTLKEKGILEEDYKEQ
jgi:hypothetical protein